MKRDGSALSRFMKGTCPRFHAAAAVVTPASLAREQN